MDTTYLAKYEEKERQIARSLCGKALTGDIISDPECIFADLLPLPKPRALHRPTTPLGILCLLYPRTFVFVPPTSVERFEERLGGVKIFEFMSLVEHNLVQPIIGHPKQYADLPYLDPLFDLNPPSIWARGTEIILGVGGDLLFEEARRVLPLDAIAKIDWIRQKWRRQHFLETESGLSKRIKEEVVTNYVNLCAFGFHNYARQDIARIHEPSRLVSDLLDANEIAVYPKLMAAGGTPTYLARKKLEISGAQNAMTLDPVIQTPPNYVDEGLEFLLRQCNLIFPTQLSVEQLVKFHESGEGEKLRQVVADIEAVLVQLDCTDVDHLITNAERFKKEVQEALIKIGPYDRTRRRFQKGMKFGLFGLGCLSATWIVYNLTGNWQGIIGGVPAGAALIRLSEDFRLSEGAINALLSWKFGRIVANMWWLTRPL